MKTSGCRRLSVVRGEYLRPRESARKSVTAVHEAVGMRTVFWFRKGLRLHDNPALVAALEGCTTLYPVFCLDPWFVSSGKVGTNRMRFLLQARP